MATHSSILARRISWTVQAMGLQRVRHDLSDFHFQTEALYSFNTQPHHSQGSGWWSPCPDIAGPLQSDSISPGVGLTLLNS